MALSEKTEFSSLTVLADGQINIRRDRVILDGDVEISRQPHRWVLEPGQDISELPEHVQRVAKAVWDKKCVKDFKDKRAKQIAEFVPPGLTPTDPQD